MKSRSIRVARSAFVPLLSLAAACSGGGETAGADREGWQGTVESVGNVTTVRNVSGSVWGGTATLVGQLSIGVEVGEDPYMFGSIAGIWATEDRIYVADYRVPAIRVFDHDGGYIMDLGREGQGPGEYQGPNSVVVAQDGRIYSKDGSPGGRVNVYNKDGESVDTLHGDPMLGSGWPLVATRAGSVYTPVRGDPDSWQDGPRLSGMAIPGPDGIVGEILVVPTLGFEFQGVYVNDRMTTFMPFAPSHRWAMSPSGAIVVGITGEYRFEIHGSGDHVTVVEKSWEPLPVDPGEAEWRRRATVMEGRRWQEGFSWDGAGMPDRMPAWSGLTVDADGRIWIARRGPSRRVEDCDPDPFEVTEGRARSCWESDLTYEVFDEEGLFLGGVDLAPVIASLRVSFITGDRMFVAVEDEAGTPMVKRYRIVLPS